MKYLKILMLLFLSTTALTQVNWTVINSIQGDFSFELPGLPDDTLVTDNLLIYPQLLDSIYTFGVYYYSEFNIDSMNMTANEAIDYIIQEMLITYEYELTSVQSVPINGIASKEFSLLYEYSYEGSSEIHSEQQFYRVFIWSNHLLILNTFAPEENLPEMIPLKDYFFQSVIIN